MNDTVPLQHKLFVPPAPVPRTTPPSIFATLKALYQNPIELWGSRTYKQPTVHITEGFGGPLLVANDPDLIRRIMVSRVDNYAMNHLRQKILRPILNDGLLTAEGSIWKRSRKAMAPVFTPRTILGFAQSMKDITEEFSVRFSDNSAPRDIATDMTELTFDILAETLFSGEVEGDHEEFLHEVEGLFETAGRIDPMDLLNAPSWVPRITRIRGKRHIRFFQEIVGNTVRQRAERMARGEEVPDDFLTLLLNIERHKADEEGLGRSEIEDNVITFFGAGHETTSRALGWTLYLLAKSPHEREKVEAEVDSIAASNLPPQDWLDAMPVTRAAFEEAMRLYPPAPSISRRAVEDDEWGDIKITAETQVFILTWSLHRHELYWENPNAFDPSRFLPENRDRIHKYQYLPFGAGPRICIGASFALQEAVIILGILLSRFRFDMAPGASEPWPVQKLTTQPKAGISMVVCPR